MFSSVPSSTGRRVAGAVGCKVGSRVKAAVCRFFSASEDTPSFSAYEYPTRTEAPEITATAAKDFSHEQIERATSSKIRSPDDPFDDTLQLTSEQREQMRNQTKQTLDSFKLNSLPITKTVPYFVPNNFPSDELEAPETRITKLDNGIRVVSQDTYGQVTTVGVLANVGSRHEPTPGVVHMLETMAFGATKNFTGTEITELLQDWGATRFVSHAREQTMHAIDILRPNVDMAMGLLSDVVLEPKISESVDDFNHVLDAMAFQAGQQMPQLILGEALQVAAYGSDQQLGKLHFPTTEIISQLSPALVEEFFINSIKNNPQNMVIAGAGISHEALVDLANEYFGRMSQLSAPITVPSTYRGGSHQIEMSAIPPIFSQTKPSEKYCHVALAFPVGGWHSDAIVTACVLQTLLGGGSSFSAGGPGKGMYSRIYQKVLNRYGFLESAEAFTTFSEDGGLFGVSASTSDPKKVLDLVTILGEQLALLALTPVGDIELSRAKNMLKCNVLTQLESRLILFEDMGRQILTYDKREDAATTCSKIDSVTAADIQKLVQDMLKENPTIASTGSHLDQVPTYHEVSRWFR